MQKPDQKSFDPLSLKEHDYIKKIINAEIDKIYEKEQFFQKSIGNKKYLINWTGSSVTTQEIRFTKIQTNLSTVVATLYYKYPDYPVDTPHELLKKDEEFGTSSRLNYERMASSFKFIKKRMEMQNVGGFVPFLIDNPKLKFGDVINCIYPNANEAAIIRIGIELDTGWSPDVVSRINKDGFYLSLVPGRKYVWLHSTKEKGQSTKLPYRVDKETTIYSDVDDRYSAFNLIKLWIKRTDRLRATKAYDVVRKSFAVEPLLVCIPDLQNMIAKNTSILVYHPKSKTLKNRSATNKFITNLTGIDFDERQLRPTVNLVRQQRDGHSIIHRALLMGHAFEKTTDQFYSNGAEFQVIRKQKLAKELIEVEQSLRDGSFAGKMIPLKSKRTIKERMMSVFYDARNEYPLSVCSDPYQPSWPGSEIMKKGVPCKRFSKCLLCKSSEIYSENIPWIVERMLVLEKKKEELPERQFGIYEDEYQATKEIVDQWPYDEDIDESVARFYAEGPILPPQIMEY